MDFVHTMPEFCDQFKIPWQYMCEEDFERSFGDFEKVQEQLHNRVPIREICHFRGLNYLVKNFQPTRSIRSGFSEWKQLEYSNVVISSCVRFVFELTNIYF